MSKINVKIRDLVDYLWEQHCGIDEYYADYIDWWIQDKIDDSDGKLNESNILDWELDEYLSEINEFLDSCFRNEFGNILFDVNSIVRKRDNKE